MARHDEVGQRHDHLFQVLFAEPEHAAPLLRSALPARLSEHIEWRSLTRCQPGQRGRRGKHTICDLLFSVRLHGDRQLLLYVVLEHKSASSRWVALQMLDQVAAVARTHRREHPQDRSLPPVLPIVVHAGPRPWQAPLDVRELFDSIDLPADLHRHLPSLEYVLDDLHTAPPERLRQRALTILGLCGLSTLQYLPPAARDPQAFSAWVDAWQDVLQAASDYADTTGNEELFAAVVDYVLDTCELPRPVVHRVLDHRLTDDTMKKKFASTLTQTRAEGIAEGIAEGTRAGRQSLLLRLIARRFGNDAATAVEPRLRAATVAELDRFADRVLDAATLHDLFTDPSD